MSTSPTAAGRRRLNTAQLGVWYAQRMDPGNPVFNMGGYLEIRGPVDPGLFQTVLTTLIAEDETARLRFTEADGVPSQEFGPAPEVTVPVIDLSAEPDPIDEAVRQMRADLAVPRDPGCDELFGNILFQLGPEHLLWYNREHHLIHDGHTATVVRRRAAQLYNALVNGEDAGTPMASFARLLDDQESYPGSSAHRQDGEYWRRIMADATAPPAPSAAPTHRIVRRITEVDDSVFADLRRFGERAGVTWQQALTAAAVAHRYLWTGDPDVLMSLPVPGRLGPSCRAPGMAANILPLRCLIDPAESAEDLAKRVSALMLRAQWHQRYDSDELLRDLGWPIRGGRRFGPVVNVLAGDEPADFIGATIGCGLLSTGGTAEDVSLTVSRGAAGSVRIDFTLDPAFQDYVDLAAYQRTFNHLLAAMTAAVGTPVGDVDLLGPDERDLVLNRWNDAAPVVDNPSAEISPAVTLDELFRRQAQRTPDAPAIAFQDQRLSYAQLANRANQLARHLAEAGVERGDLVGVLLERGVDFAVALLAVITAGAGYTVLDPDFPDERLASVAADAGVRVAVSREGLASRLPEVDRVVRVDTEADAISALSPEDLRVDVRPLDTACVMFTSGSTGRPKGVLTPHRALVGTLASQRYASFGPDEVFLQCSPVSWDAFSLEFWGSLLFGGLCVLQSGQRPEPALISSLAEEHGVTMLQLSSGLFNVMVDEYPQTFARLRLAFTGGEPSSGAHVERIRTRFPELIVSNGYGPAESMGFSTYYPVPSPWTRADVPVGGPVAGKRVYVLDPRLRPTPIGAVGEVYLAGAGLAHGYLGRPALTAGRFIADPFGGGDRLYRTGDMARWTADGVLEFTGRADGQVKIRGFRVEPGEVEVALLGQESVAQAAVTTIADARGVLRLVAYVVGAAGPEGNSQIDGRALRERLRSALPEYMVPSVVEVLDRLPLTANGKIDRAALPVPSFEASGTGRGPRDAREEILCALFAEVLGLESVGVDEDFFELGGHSLAAARLAARAGAVYGAQLTLADVFHSCTVANLAELLASREGARQLPPLTASPRPARLPLSFAQRRLWYAAASEGGSAAYNVPLSVRLEGGPVVGALRDAIGDLVRRHEVLRTVFESVDGEPYQRVLDPDASPVFFDFVASAPDLVAGQLAEAAAHTFDLAAEPPIRVTLFDLGDAHVLLILLHHIATDGLSLRPLFDDISAAYAARVEGRNPDWTPLPIQYADYTLWQRAALGLRSDPDSLLTADLAYWKTALADLPEELGLALDRPRPALAGHRGGAVLFEADAELRRGITALARAEHCTAFMVLQAALALTLTRLGAGTDVPIGSPVAGRGDPLLDPMVGFFVNTLVLRTDTSGDPEFRELLARVRQTDLDAFAHQEAPFDLVLEELDPVRSLARHPLFQICLALEGEASAGAGPRLTGLSAGPGTFVDTGTAKFDLEFLLREENDGGFGGAVLYSADIFDHATADRLVQTYLRVLEQVVAEPGRTLGAVDVLTSAERGLVLDQWSGSGTCPDAESAIADLSLSLVFERQVAAAPEATALVHDGRRVSYGELNRQANTLARRLGTAGVRRGDLVGVLLERSVEFAVGLLAVVKAGAAYVVLDPEFPDERINVLLSEAGVETVVTDSALAGRVPGIPQLVHVDDVTPAITALDDSNPSPGTGLNDIACVMFTSGSTGRPKGVLAPHRAILGTLIDQQYASFGPNETFLQCSPVSWDAFSLEFWGSLLYGGVCVLQSGQRPEPGAIALLTAEHGVTMLQLSSGLFNVLADEYPRSFDGVRLVFTAGEAASGAHVARVQALYPDLLVANGYGPAESMGLSTSFDIPAAWAGGAVPVGSPVHGKRAYLLDDRLQPVPVGVPGEVYLGGVGLAHGYLGRPDLTAQRFVADPFGDGNGEGNGGHRLYRTGDVARWTTDGLLDFVGRADGQIKVRGFRVEPGEVEAALLVRPDVAQAAVAGADDGRGVIRLAAYVVAPPGAQADGREVREWLRGRLPDHMVPAVVKVLDRLPLTANGKVDRAALPEPGFTGPGGGRAARDAREEVLCGLFADVLGLSSVGIDDGFFDLGGHSLSAARLVARVRTVLGAELTIRDVFLSPTVAELSERYGAPAGDGSGAPAAPVRRRPALRRRTEAGVLREGEEAVAAD